MYSSMVIINDVIVAIRMQEPPQPPVRMWRGKHHGDSHLARRIYFGVAGRRWCHRIGPIRIGGQSGVYDRNASKESTLSAGDMFAARRTGMMLRSEVSTVFRHCSYTYNVYPGHLFTACCGDIDPHTPGMYGRFSNPSGGTLCVPIMLCESTTLKPAVVFV